MAKVLVIGSSNTDMVVKSDKLPKPGETLLGGEFFMNQGGKGANQAVAASRLGGDVTFVTKLGNDVFGKQTTEHFLKEGINTKFVFTDDHAASGVALITVDAKGENSIVVASGANNTITKSEIDNAEETLKEADVVLLQLEIPLEIIDYVVEKAAGYNKKVILNPAPAATLNEKIFKNLFAITPNETEAELLTGVQVTDIDTATKAAKVLYDKGVNTVIITLGSQGAFVYTATEQKLVPGHKVDAVDTTAAGDTFNGALAAALANGKSLEEGIAFANKAASISVTRMGAQSSVPTLDEIK